MRQHDPEHPALCDAGQQVEDEFNRRLGITAFWTREPVYQRVSAVFRYLKVPILRRSREID